jgi:CRISPR-associated protein Cmr4
VSARHLWYEEHLPPDCLFLALIGQRRQRFRGGEAKATPSESKRPALAVLREHAQHLRIVQIGGNETLGYGLCWWSGWATEGTS